MKSLCLGLLLLSLTCAGAKQIDVDNGDITFDAPDDFTPLTQDEIAKKFPMRNGPIEAWGNDTRGVSISYGITKVAVRPEQLSELKDVMTVNMAKLVPDMQWVKNDFVEIDGTKWIYFENITPAGDQNIHNIEIITSYRNVMFAINFNATAKLFDDYRDKLQASLNSVKIKDNTATLQPLPISRQGPVSAEGEAQRGLMAGREGDLDRAEEAFNAALLMNPKLASAQIGLGIVDFDKGLFDDAIKNYSDALANDPNSGEAFARRAIAEAENCDLDVASADIQKAIDHIPDNPLTYRIRAVIEERSGDLDHALADFNQALTLRSNYSPALDGRGWLSLIHGNLDQARQDFEIASVSGRNDPGTLYDMAVLFLLEGKQDDALVDLRSVAELASRGRSTGSARLLMWVIEAGQGHETDASQELSTYLKDNSQLKNEWVKNIGAFLVNQMSEADLIASADSSNSLKNQIQHCRIWYFIGVKHQVAGENTKATEAFHECLATDQKFLEYDLLAKAQLSKGDSIGAGFWVDSQLGPILDAGNKYGVTSLVVLLLGGFFLSFSIITVVVVVLVLNSGPKRSSSPRVIDRVPPMR